MSFKCLLPLALVALVGCQSLSDDEPPLPTLFASSRPFLIGQLPDKHNATDAQHASDAAQSLPATPTQARQSATADLNHDGFVTLDEVVAMHDAGLNDTDILQRLRATHQYFHLTQSQQKYLLQHGVNRTIVDQLRSTL